MTGRYWVVLSHIAGYEHPRTKTYLATDYPTIDAVKQAAIEDLNKHFIHANWHLEICSMEHSCWHDTRSEEEKARAMANKKRRA